jgi:hypothetical protein
MKKLKNEVTTDVLDTSTGELIRTTTQKTYSVKVDQDAFFMTYIKYMSVFFKLKYADDMKVLAKFCQICSFDKGIVVLSASQRKEIEEELNLLPTNFSRSLKRLKEIGLITGDKGTFVINPELYWKGNNKTRNDILKLKELKVEIEFKQQ